MLTVKTFAEKTIANKPGATVGFGRSSATHNKNMKKYTSLFRASIALAAVATLITTAPDAGADLPKPVADSVRTAAKLSTSALVAKAKEVVRNATDKVQAAKDIAALIAKEYPRLANVVVGNLAADNKPAAAQIAAAAAQANKDVAVAVARSAAAAAPGYKAQIINSVTPSNPAAAVDIASAVDAAVAASLPEQAAIINNPVDVSTSIKTN